MHGYLIQGVVEATLPLIYRHLYLSYKLRLTAQHADVFAEVIVEIGHDTGVHLLSPCFMGPMPRA